MVDNELSKLDQTKVDSLRHVNNILDMVLIVSEKTDSDLSDYRNKLLDAKEKIKQASSYMLIYQIINSDIDPVIMALDLHLQDWAARHPNHRH